MLHTFKQFEIISYDIKLLLFLYKVCYSKRKNYHSQENFATLLDEFRVEFDIHKLILSAAVSAGKPTIDASYDVHAIVRNMDMVHLMTYDFHGAWENETHHNAPLCGYPSDYGDMIYFRVVSFCLNLLIRTKLNLSCKILKLFFY